MQAVSMLAWVPQVAKALDASGAGEVVVSDQVWQHLAGTGWGSSPVQGDVGPSSPHGLRLLHWTPGPGPGGPEAGCWDDDIDSSSSSIAAAGRGGGGAASIAPAHGGAGVLAGDGGVSSSSKGASDSPPLVAPLPKMAVPRRSSYSGGGRVGPAAAAVAAAGGGGGRGVPGPLHGRSVSLDHPASGAAGGSVTAGGRFVSCLRRTGWLSGVAGGGGTAVLVGGKSSQLMPIAYTPRRRPLERRAGGTMDRRPHPLLNFPGARSARGIQHVGVTG